MLDPFDASTLDVASPLLSPLEPVSIAAATEEDKDNYAQFWASQLMESKEKKDEYAEMVDQHDGQAFVVLLTTQQPIEQEPSDDFKAYMLPCSSEEDDEKRRKSCQDFQDFLDTQRADDEKMQKDQVNCANEPHRRPPSVALIDDDICQLTFLKAQFANLGAAVTTFASGSDFLNKGHGVHEKDICW